MTLSKRRWWIFPALAVLLWALLPSPAYAAVPATPMRTVSFNGPVRAVAYVGDTIYVGGDFTAAYLDGKRSWRSHIAALNAQTGALLPFAPELDGTVHSMAVSGSDLYVGGYFTVIDGWKRRHIARFSGGKLHPWRHSLSGVPRALAAADGKLYAGGSFTLADNQARANVAAFDLTTDMLLPWAPAADGTVRSITPGVGRVYLSGVFNNINGTQARKLAAVRPDGSLDTAFAPKLSVIVYDVAVTHDRVYAVAGGSGGQVLAYDLSGNVRWQKTTDGDAQALAMIGDVLYVGGHFENLCSSSRTGANGVCLDGSSAVRGKFLALSADGVLDAWDPAADSTVGVWCLATSGGALAAGGEFLTFAGGTVQQRGFAQFRA